MEEDSKENNSHKLLRSTEHPELMPAVNNISQTKGQEVARITLITVCVCVCACVCMYVCVCVCEKEVNSTEGDIILFKENSSDPY